MVRYTNIFLADKPMVLVYMFYLLQMNYKCIINEIYYIINYIGDKFKTNLQIEYHDKII